MEPLALIADLRRTNSQCVKCRSQFEIGEIVKHYSCGDAVHQHCYIKNREEVNPIDLENCPMEHGLSGKRWIKFRTPPFIPRMRNVTIDPLVNTRPKLGFTPFADRRGWLKTWQRPQNDHRRCQQCFINHSQDPNLNDVVIHAPCHAIYHGNCWSIGEKCRRCNRRKKTSEFLFRLGHPPAAPDAAPSDEANPQP